MATLCQQKGLNKINCGGIVSYPQARLTHRKEQNRNTLDASPLTTCRASTCRTLVGWGAVGRSRGERENFTHIHIHICTSKNFFKISNFFLKGRGVLLCEVLVCVIALESSPTIQETQDLSALPPYYTATGLELQPHFVYNIHYA